ncbi:unnamed protein product, partial [marine sediment metagenome]
MPKIRIMSRRETRRIDEDGRMVPYVDLHYRTDEGQDARRYAFGLWNGATDLVYDLYEVALNAIDAAIVTLKGIVA